MRRLLPFAAFASLFAGCTAPPAGVRTWGTMREVLREGRDAGRVTPVEVATDRTVGVGALAGLAGEVTIVDGHVWIAVAHDGQPPTVRNATAADRAALLAVADVARWTEVPLGTCASYDDLERRIAEALAAGGLDPTLQPVRVRGRASLVRLHVIAGACPIANPDGPSPWRFAGPVEAIELVGLFATGAAGRLTHHDRRSHLHAVAPGLTGHLDDVALTDAVLLLPAHD